MATSDHTLKQCCRKDKCINPLGSWLPASNEHFHRDKNRKDGLAAPCKECAKAHVREHSANNQSVIKEQRKQFRAANKERLNRDRREWDDAHPDVIRERKLRLLAKKFHLSGEATAEDIQLQYKSQKGLCWWCGNPVGDTYHVDHRIAVSRGGSNDPANLVISCPFCNQSKRNKLPWEWNGRLL